MSDRQDDQNSAGRLCSRLDNILASASNDIDINGALQTLGELVDLASRTGDEVALDHALAISNAIEACGLDTKEQFTLLYFRANIWGSFVRLKEGRGELDRAAWHQAELGQELLLLRAIVSNEQFKQWSAVRRAQVFTNLGSILSTLGRVVEAIEYRDKALQTVPRFGMALGTRAETVLAYGNALYQKQDRLLFCAAAIDGFAEATAESARYENDYRDSISHWVQRHAQLEQWLKANQPQALIAPTGLPQAIRAYREWCLQNHLFLDPVNDLGPIGAAARDRLHLPGIAPHNARSEMLMGYLDTMQQEFVSARWSLYEALTLGEEHISDATFAPHDTGDGPKYGLRIERLKSAYRMAYSIFDKIGFFVNAWLTLNIKPDKVSFKTVWVDAKTTAIRPVFSASKNWPLRGLYWLSRDLFEPEYRDVVEPDAQAVATIRNHLEHKYLRIVTDDAYLAQTAVAADPLVYVVRQSLFEKRTMRILKLARAALIYLVLAVHDDERRKSTGARLGPRTKLPRL